MNLLALADEVIERAHAPITHKHVGTLCRIDY
jgi:hypothetical protein